MICGCVHMRVEAIGEIDACEDQDRRECRILDKFDQRCHKILLLAFDDGGSLLNKVIWKTLLAVDFERSSYALFSILPSSCYRN